MFERYRKAQGSLDRFRFGVFLVIAALAVFGSSLQAATEIKANNTDNLNLGSSWVSGVAPGAVDILLWDSTVTGANTVSLGTIDLLISEIQINDPGGLVTINGLGTLQLGSLISNVGINMSSATADLTINSRIALEDTSLVPTWIVAAGRTLTVNGDVDENGPTDKTLTIDGAGTTRINGIIGTGQSDLGITKNGTGMLVLTGANLYGDDTTINGGVVRISNAAALGAASGNTIINAGGELQLLGNISIASGESISLTGTGAGGPGSAAIRNISGGNQLNGDIKLQDVEGVVRINSDSGNLALLGDITEDGGTDKVLAFGGHGDTTVSGNIGGGTDILALVKDGSGTLELTGNNAYKGTTVITEGTLIISGGNGDITDSVGITINNSALTLDNTLANKNDRIGNVPITMNSGTFNYIHGATSTDFTETIDGTVTLSSGASTIRTDASAADKKSILTFDALARMSGATVNFIGGSGNPSAASDDNNVRFKTHTAGFIGAWATVGGTNFATYNDSVGATESVEALTTYEQTLTRLSSGTKIIASNAGNNVQITEGTGTAGDITLGSANTIINTLTNSATGVARGAGGVTIDPAGQTFQVNGILNAAGSTELTIGNGTNNGMLTAKGAGGEVIIQNFSDNAVTVNSVIANNSTASSLTKAGTGSVIVTAANTYSGGTFVNQGTLQVAGTTGALANTSRVTVNTSGTLLLSSTTAALGGQIHDSAAVVLAGGTIRAGVNGIDETVGALTLSSNSIIDFATLTGPNNLRFADSALARAGTWTAGTTLSIINYTAGTDHLFFGTLTGAGVTTAQLGQINFFSDSDVGSFLGAAGYLADGEVAPVPEPSTWIGGVLTIAAVAITQRRRLRKMIVSTSR